MECCLLYRQQGHKVPYYAMTHEEIAEELGISKQAVQQIERQALAKLHRKFGYMKDKFL